MSDHPCDLAWQVEAIRDGRLEATLAHAEHRKRCAACRQEHERLNAVTTALRGSSTPPHDDLRVARLRRRVMESADHARLVAPTSFASRGVAIASATAAAFLVVGGAAAWRASNVERPRAVLHSSEPVRFDHRFTQGREEIALDDGTLDVWVRPGAGDPVVVRVPDGVIADRGTSFRVRVHDGHTTVVRVFHGSVEFRRTDGTTLLLGAGDSWHAPAPVAPVATRQPEVAPTPVATAPLAPSTSAERTAARPIHRVTSAHPDHVGPAVSPTRTSTEDALYLEAVLLSRAGQNAAASEAARRYLAAFPEGFRAVELRRMVQTTESTGPARSE